MQQQVRGRPSLEQGSHDELVARSERQWVRLGDQLQSQAVDAIVAGTYRALKKAGLK